MERDQIVEMFSAFGAVDVRRIFGGVGVYSDGLMFALAHDGVLYLKADDLSRDAFERENQCAFTYATKHGKRVLTSYWRVPDRLYDEPDELARWAADACEAARRAQTKTPRKRGR